MKKTLVAVAALAAVSGAMADVTITGLVEAAYSTSTASRAITTGQNGGSEVRFGGSEDLGNGLKANFNLESSLAVDTGVAGSLFDRTATVGMSGSQV